MIPTTYSIYAQRGPDFFKVDLEGREAFGPTQQREAEAFAAQLLVSSRKAADKAEWLDRVFVMKHSVARVYGSAPRHPENEAEQPAGDG